MKGSLFHTVDQLELAGAQQHRLDAIQRGRAAASEAFFSSNTDKFAQQQELIATPDQYLEPMLQLVETLQLPDHVSALELGPGTGWLLPQLAHIADTVTAVDSSSEMLDCAQQFCRENSLNAIRFVHGDSRSLHDLQQNFDLAVVNMVLHHTPSPAASNQRPGRGAQARWCAAHL